MIQNMEKLKERFCKDCNIPIKIYTEPYFTERLVLLDKFYGTIDKYHTFITECDKYSSEQEYFEEYNRVKDEAITKIKNSPAYERFNNENMNKYKITHINLPNHDIYKETNVGKRFISIDMKKANFSSLQYYDKEMFMTNSGIAMTWEDFIGQFTDNKHIINSKYVRQVVLGNCNPKRHITYEKWIMDNILTKLTKELINLKNVVFFSNDEIVFTVDDISEEEQNSLVEQVEQLICEMAVPLRAEYFELYRIEGTDGYCKNILNKTTKYPMELKCLNSLFIPFVARHLLKEPVTSGDRTFYYEGLMAELVEVPKISISKS